MLRVSLPYHTYFKRSKQNLTIPAIGSGVPSEVALRGRAATVSRSFRIKRIPMIDRRLGARPVFGTQRIPGTEAAGAGAAASRLRLPACWACFAHLPVAIRAPPSPHVQNLRYARGALLAGFQGICYSAQSMREGVRRRAHHTFGLVGKWACPAFFVVRTKSGADAGSAGRCAT